MCRGCLGRFINISIYCWRWGYRVRMSLPRAEVSISISTLHPVEVFQGHGLRYHPVIQLCGSVRKASFTPFAGLATGSHLYSRLYPLGWISHTHPCRNTSMATTFNASTEKNLPGQALGPPPNVSSYPSLESWKIHSLRRTDRLAVFSLWNMPSEWS